MREQFWMDKFKSDGYELVNKYKAYQSKKERNDYIKKYHEDNRNELNNKSKQYQRRNKNKSRQSVKRYRDKYREEINLFRKRSVLKLMSEFILDIQDY